MKIKTGYGYDIHRIIPKDEKKPFLLAGIEVEAPFSLSAHSDGDVLFHALTNALLSAIGEEDIGCHFSDREEKNRDRDSSEMLRFACDLLIKKGFRIESVNLNIRLEQPKLYSYRKSIKERISSLLNVAEEDISISCNTGENVGPVGRQEAIEVSCVVLVTKN